MSLIIIVLLLTNIYTSFAPTLSIQRGIDDYEYIIITTEALKGSWDDFVAFNKRRCLRTKIVTIESINETGYGKDSPEKLKNLLKKEYTDHNILYVMLGGDDKISTDNQILPDAITHRGYSAEVKDFGTDPIRDEDIAADMYYETLDGQELEDLDWELFCGRFPADDTTELRRMIHKTMKYSEAPITGVLKNSMLVGQKLWANINGGTVYGTDGLTLLIGDCNKHFTTAGFDSLWQQIILKERGSSWTKNTLINHINSGVHVLNHIGLSSNMRTMKMDRSDIGLLQNNAFFIGYSDHCYIGSFDNRRVSYSGTFNTGHYEQDCFAEEFTVGTKFGAVAFVCPARFYFGDNGWLSNDATNGVDLRFRRYFYDALFGQKIHHLSTMLAQAKWINRQEILVSDPNTPPYYGQMAFVCFQLNLLGDPALSFWTEKPKTWIKVNWQFDGKVFTFDTKCPYTWVALCGKDGTIIATQLTGEDGACKIDDTDVADYFTQHPHSDLRVRIKAHNYFPYFSGQTAIHTRADDQGFTLERLSQTATAITFTVTTMNSMPVTIALYNTRGALLKVVATEEISPSSLKICLPLQKLSKGIYYLRCSSGGLQYVKKVVLQ